MKQLRKYAAYLSVALSLLASSPAYASLATVSDAQAPDDALIVDDDWMGDDAELVATSSDATLDDRINDLMDFSAIPMAVDSGITAYASVPGFASLDNTVSPDGIQVLVIYNKTDGSTGTINCGRPTLMKWSNGNRTLGYTKKPTIPSDFVSVNRILLQISSVSLPPSGKYEAQFVWCNSTEAPSDVSKVEWYSRKNIANAQYQESYKSLTSTMAGNTLRFTYVAPGVIDFGTVSYVEFRVYPTVTTSETIPGSTTRFSIVLKKVDSSTTADITTAGGSYTSTDAAQDTAQNTTQIAENTADMADTLKEIVQTISNQLAALWDQMYNLMHVPQLANDDKNTQLIIDKLGEDLSVEIQNDNDNTDTIVNGYDSSDMDSVSNDLDNSLDTFDSAEKVIVDEASGYINDFEIKDIGDYAGEGNVLNALSAISHIMQLIYNRMGAFTAAIDVSLTFVFVLMLVGYHRFRAR